MKKLIFFSLTILIIVLAFEKLTINNYPILSDKDDIIPLAIRNSWKYLYDSSDMYREWLITEKKSMPVVFPDSSEIVTDIYI